MAQDEGNAFLFGGGGARSARFANHGDLVSGQVLEFHVSQRTDIKTGEPQFWANGDKMMQLVITLQTTQREDEDDDGQRALYVKGSTKTGSRSLHAAVADAVRSSGAKELEIGGTLAVRYEGDKPSATPGLNDSKLYAAVFHRPNPSSGFLGLGTQDAPAQQPTQQPAQQPQRQQDWPPAPPAQQPQQSGPAETGWSAPTHVEGAPAATQAGPSAADLERFNAWKANQG